MYCSNYSGGGDGLRIYICSMPPIPLNVILSAQLQLRHGDPGQHTELVIDSTRLQCLHMQ